MQRRRNFTSPSQNFLRTEFSRSTSNQDVPGVFMEMEGERLRKEMNKNNAVLQDYAENISFLKVQTRLLQDKSEEQAQETLAMKEEYEYKLSAAHDLAEKMKDEKAHLEVEVEDLVQKMVQQHKELEVAKRLHEEDVKKITELEEKISILTVRLENNPMIVELQRDKETIAKLEDDVRSIGQDCLTEINSRLEVENRMHTLSEELKFLRADHKQCQKRLAILESRETNVIYSDFWKKELSQLRVSIRSEFLVEQETAERNHKFQVQELQTRVEHLSEQLSKSQEQIERAQKDLSAVEMEKAQLENEVFSLRQNIEQLNHLQNKNDELQDQVEKLLKLERQTLNIQSEVNTYGKTLKNLASIRPNLAAARPIQPEHAESHTTCQRTASGPVAIAETHPEGKYIVLKNNFNSGGRKDINLGNWSLQRLLDNKRKIVYRFPPNAVIKLGKTLKIWAADFSAERGAGDLVFKEEGSWGTGSQITTSLYNERNEEKASHIQKTFS